MFLLAAMVVVATASNPFGDKMDLYSERGSICPETTQGRAVYTLADKSTVEGCWMWYGDKDDDEVAISFVDNDRYVMKRKALTWAKNARGSCN